MELPDGAKIPVFVDLPPDGQAGSGHRAEGGRRWRGARALRDPDLVVVTAATSTCRGWGRVLVVDGDPGDTPVSSEVYFLERALAPGELKSGVSVDVISPVGLSSPRSIAWCFSPTCPIRVPSARGSTRLCARAVRWSSRGAATSRQSATTAFAGVLPSPIRDVRALAARKKSLFRSSSLTWRILVRALPS